MAKDYYDILGVSKNSNADEIKSAFRKKAHEHHPDKGGDTEKFKELNEAYQVLGNTEKRQRYDQFGSAAFDSGGAGGWGGFNGSQGFSGFQSADGHSTGMNFDFEDLGDMFGGFGDMFGFGGGRNPKRSTRGRDLEMSLKLEFLEAIFGLEKELSFTKNVSCNHCHGKGAEPGSKLNTCSTCGGTGRVTRIQRTILGNIQAQSSCSACGGEGQYYSQKCTKCGGSGLYRENIKLKVKIPAGINEGESIRLSGQGEAGEKGAPAGDLYLRIKINTHKTFVRDHYDIRTEAVISVKQAILGDKIDIETVHGSIKLKIPTGTQSGTVFKLKEKGVIKLHNRGLGDHYVRVVVNIPANLDKKQRVLLENLDI